MGYGGMTRQEAPSDTTPRERISARQAERAARYSRYEEIIPAEGYLHTGGRVIFNPADVPEGPRVYRMPMTSTPQTPFTPRTPFRPQNIPEGAFEPVRSPGIRGLGQAETNGLSFSVNIPWWVGILGILGVGLAGAAVVYAAGKALKP